MPSRIRKFVALPAADKVLVLRAGLELLTISVALRFLPYSQLKRFCQRVAERSIYPAESRISRVTYAINAAATVVPRTACLARALACQRMLGTAGISTKLKIGVVKKAESLIHAHAWLEYDGRVILGDSPELPIYSRL